MELLRKDITNCLWLIQQIIKTNYDISLLSCYLYEPYWAQAAKYVEFFISQTFFLPFVSLIVWYPTRVNCNDSLCKKMKTLLVFKSVNLTNMSQVIELNFWPLWYSVIPWYVIISTNTLQINEWEKSGCVWLSRIRETPSDSR